MSKKNSNVVNLLDVFDEDKLSEFDSVMLQLIKDNQQDEFNPEHYIVLGVQENRVRMMYSIEPDNEFTLMQFKGYLDTLQTIATHAVLSEDDYEEL